MRCVVGLARMPPDPLSVVRRIATTIVSIAIAAHSFHAYSNITPQSDRIIQNTFRRKGSDEFPSVRLYGDFPSLHAALHPLKGQLPSGAAAFMGTFRVSPENATAKHQVGHFLPLSGCKGLTFEKNKVGAKCRTDVARRNYFNPREESFLMKSVTVLAVCFLLVLIPRTFACVIGVWSMLSSVGLTFKHVLSRFLSSSGGDGLKERARGESTKRQCRLAGSFAAYVFPLSSLLLAGMVALATFKYYPLMELTRLDEREQLIDSDVLPVALSCLILLSLHRPQFPPTANAVDRANVLFSLIWIWMYCTIDPRYYAYKASIIWTCRTMQLLVLGNPRLSFFLQGLASLIDIASYIAHDVDRACEFGDLGERGQPVQFDVAPCGFNPMRYQYQQGYIGVQVFLIFTNLAIQRSFESLRFLQVCALLEAKRSDRSSMLAQSLLSAMCDAVVKLNRDFSIKEPCPKLASLILRGGSDMLSYPILDIVAPADRDLFTETLERVAYEYGPESESACMHARAMHVSICDMNRTTVPVEVFASCVLGEDDQLVFIIGIKEDSNDRDMDYIAEVGSIRPMSIPENSGVVVPQGSMSCASLDSNESDSSSDISGSIDSQAFSECRDLSAFEDISVLVHASSEELTFSHCSQSFYFLNAPRPLGTGLKEWLDEESFAKLQHNFRCQSDASTRVALHPPGSKSKYTAFAHTHGCTEGSARIRFSEVELVTKPTKHKVEKKERGKTRVRVRVFDGSMEIIEQLSHGHDLSKKTRPGKRIAKLLEHPSLLSQSLVQEVIAAQGNDLQGCSRSLGMFEMKPFSGMALSLLPQLRVDLEQIERGPYNELKAILSLELQFTQRIAVTDGSYAERIGQPPTLAQSSEMNRRSGEPPTPAQSSEINRRSGLPIQGTLLSGRFHL